MRYTNEQGQVRSIDLVSLVSVADASDAAQGVVLELTSPRHIWRIAPVDFENFERLRNALQRLSSLHELNLRQVLHGDEGAVKEMRALLEKDAYDRDEMNLAERDMARALRDELAKLSEKGGKVLKSEKRGYLEVTTGKMGVDEEKDRFSEEKAQVNKERERADKERDQADAENDQAFIKAAKDQVAPPTRTTSSRTENSYTFSNASPVSPALASGYLRVRNAKSRAPDLHMYGIVTKEGMMRFYETEVDAKAHIAQPFGGDLLVKGSLDLASVISVRKVQDGAVEITTPTKRLIFMPRNGWGPGLFAALYGVVSTLHKAIGGLFGEWTLERGKPEEVTRREIGSAALKGIALLESCAEPGSDVSSADVESARSLRRRILSRQEFLDWRRGKDEDEDERAQESQENETDKEDRLFTGYMNVKIPNASAKRTYGVVDAASSKLLLFESENTARAHFAGLFSRTALNLFTDSIDLKEATVRRVVSKQGQVSAVAIDPHRTTGRIIVIPENPFSVSRLISALTEVAGVAGVVGGLGGAGVGAGPAPAQTPPPATAATAKGPTITAAGKVLQQEVGSIFATWKPKWYALTDMGSLLLFGSEKDRDKYLSANTTDEERSAYEGRLDLISGVLGVRSVVGSNGEQVVELQICNGRTLRFAATPTRDGGVVSLERLARSVANDVASLNRGVANLTDDEELRRTVQTVRPSRVGSRARNMLQLLDDEFWNRTSLSEADLLRARALRVELLQARGQARAASRSPFFPPAFTTNVTCHGWIWKKGGVRRNWQRRYCALYKDRSLVYFETREQCVEWCFGMGTGVEVGLMMSPRRVGAWIFNLSSLEANPPATQQPTTLPHPKGRVDLATALSLNVTHRKQLPSNVIELDTPRRRWKIAPEEEGLFAELLARLSGVVRRYNKALHVLTGDGELAKDVGIIEPALLNSNASELIHSLETEVGIFLFLSCPCLPLSLSISLMLSLWISPFLSLSLSLSLALALSCSRSLLLSLDHLNSHPTHPDSSTIRNNSPKSNGGGFESYADLSISPCTGRSQRWQRWQRELLFHYHIQSTWRPGWECTGGFASGKSRRDHHPRQQQQQRTPQSGTTARCIRSTPRRTLMRSLVATTKLLPAIAATTCPHSTTSTTSRRLRPGPRLAPSRS